MPETNGKTKRWRSKFAATKRVIAPDAPPGTDAKRALQYAMVGVAGIIAALVLTFIVNIYWLLYLPVWLISLLFAIMGALRGKFEGDVIRAGRSPVRGKPLAMTGMYAGIACAGIAVVTVIVAAFSYSVEQDTLPGKYGSPAKTYREYVRALQEDDFEAYLECLAAEDRFDRDTDDDGINDAASDEHREKLRRLFKKARGGLVRRKLTPLGKPEYSAGGTTALDARRATLYIRCFDEKRNLATDAKVKFSREDDGWKVKPRETDL